MAILVRSCLLCAVLAMAGVYLVEAEGANCDAPTCDVNIIVIQHSDPTYTGAFGSPPPVNGPVFC